MTTLATSQLMDFEIFPNKFFKTLDILKLPIGKYELNGQFEF